MKEEQDSLQNPSHYLLHVVDMAIYECHLNCVQIFMGLAVYKNTSRCLHTKCCKMFFVVQTLGKIHIKSSIKVKLRTKAAS